jgi:hypothetical protein
MADRPLVATLTFRVPVDWLALHLYPARVAWVALALQECSGLAALKLDLAVQAVQHPVEGLVGLEVRHPTFPLSVVAGQLGKL